MEFEIKKQKVLIDIDISDIIAHMNELDINEKWSLIAKILGGINLKDFKKLKVGSKDLIINFLNDNLKLYRNIQ